MLTQVTQLTLARSITPLVVKIFERLRDPQRQNKVISARHAAEVMDCIAPQNGDRCYNGDTQQDASEFLGSLLDQFEKEEMERSSSTSSESTDVHKLFSGEIQIEVSLYHGLAIQSCFH